ncbi:Phosphate regulon sensor protein PhoR (SphS), partial [hydrothermal vent metagenome]
FVANASHELRTPLTVVNGYLEMMIDMTDQVPKMWEKPLGQMHHQSLRMQAIIEDLLTLSRIESDTLMNNTKVIQVDEVLKNIEIDIRYLYDEEYDIHFSIEKGLSLKGVEEPLKSVFTNLISNAFCYTPKGGRVSIRWYSNASGAHFEVEDTGIGVPNELLSRLTERFYRVDTARSRESGGTGLGLAIVKHVLDKHESELKIQSQVGKGSIFSCDFYILS